MAVLKRIGSLLLLAAALTGCTRDPLEVTPAEDQLMVHGVLEAGVDTVVIRLTETRARQRGLAAATRGVRGAAAELSGGGVTVPMREYSGAAGGCWGMLTTGSDPDNPGCYLGVVPGGVRAGGSYVLRIDLPDGRQIRGETSIPASPELLRPVEGERWHFADVPESAVPVADPQVLRWRSEPAVAALTLSLLSDSVFHAGTSVPHSGCGVYMGSVRYTQHVDSITWRPPLFCDGWGGSQGGPQARPDSLDMRLRAVFFDTAFVRYQGLAEYGGTVRRSEAAVGLKGAAGIFTAAAVAERRVRMVPRF
jgi:hypothetical protein